MLKEKPISTARLDEAIDRACIALNNYDVLIIDKKKPHPSGLRFSDIEVLVRTINRGELK